NPPDHENRRSSAPSLTGQAQPWPGPGPGLTHNDHKRCRWACHEGGDPTRLSTRRVTRIREAEVGRVRRSVKPTLRGDGNHTGKRGKRRRTSFSNRSRATRSAGSSPSESTADGARP